MKFKPFLAGALTAVGVIVVAGGVSVWSIIGNGISARDRPSAAERTVARILRRAATPSALRDLNNPYPRTEAALEDGLAHFADHCAICHGNDGKAENFYGRNMFPPPPDMTGETQELSDGEIYAVIENGVRLTGMPAFGDGSPNNESSWNLVHFIRHLPEITPGELQQMRALNPKSPAALAAEQEEREFLEGSGELPAATVSPSHDGHDHVH